MIDFSKILKYQSLLYYYIVIYCKPNSFWLRLNIVRWASHCFPIEKARRQDFTHMIARPSINKDIENQKTVRGTLYVVPQPCDIFICDIVIINVEILFN